MTSRVGKLSERSDRDCLSGLAAFSWLCGSGFNMEYLEETYSDRGECQVRIAYVSTKVIPKTPETRATSPLCGIVVSNVTVRVICQ